MCTTRSLLYREGVSVQGALCPEGALSRGVSVRETPSPVDRQMPVKILLCPKLRLRAVNIDSDLTETVTLHMSLNLLFRFRLNFWDGLEAQYEVDMSCLKSAARDSFTRGVHVICVEPRSIIAHAHRVTCLNLMDIKTEDLANVQVRARFHSIK